MSRIREGYEEANDADDLQIEPHDNESAHFANLKLILNSRK